MSKAQQLGLLAQVEEFGRYHLIERIGIGGMAEAFRAKTAWAKGVEKTVCIKRILPPLTDNKRMREMFITEARIAASLTHANIIPVYEFGIIDEYYFLAMEYVDGHTQREMMMISAKEQNWLDSASVLHLATEVLEGLDFAHRRRNADGIEMNIVHRDITPGNLMISKAGEVKILDFGIALMASDEENRDPHAPKGKPGYMAPEQAAGMAADHRADLFSLGVILWEMCAKRRLFKCKSAQERLDFAKRVVPPSHYQNDLPEGVDDIIIKALADKPDDRYSSAAQFRDAILDLMHHHGLRAGRSTLAKHMSALFKEESRRQSDEYSIDKEIGDLSMEELDLLRANHPPRRRIPTNRLVSTVNSRKDTMEHAIASQKKRSLYGIAIGILSLLVVILAAIVGYLLILK